jgi:ACS family D-galactonate transporter-like MFS transporter
MTATQLRIAALVFALSVINYFDRTILSVAAPGIMKEFSLSPTSMGAVFSAFLISYTLLMTPGGRWSDRFGPRNMLAIMALGSGLLTALMPLGGIPGLGSLIGVIPALFVIRLGFGIFTAPLYPAAARMNAIWMPPLQRARVLGFVNAGAGFGGAVSPILFSAMLARFGWRLSFVIAGVAAVLLGVVWFVTVPDRAVEKRAAQRPQWSVLLNNSSMRWLIAGFATLDYYEYIFFYWLYYYLGEVRKLTAADTAVFTTLPFLAWVVMMPLGGCLADRLVERYGIKQGLRWVAIAALLISVLGLVIALNVADINTFVALISLAFGCAAIADVVFWAAVISIAGTHAGAAGGLMNTGGNFGGAIAPFLTPLIASYYGWSAGLYVGALVALIGVVAWLRIDPLPISELAPEPPPPKPVPVAPVTS